MRIILLGRKSIACDALRYMLSCGAEMLTVVAPEKTDLIKQESLAKTAQNFNIPVTTDDDLYEMIAHNQLQNVDLVISIVHQRLIKQPLIDLGRMGCINFHPAPLPEYRGWGTYNLGILDNIDYWGTSAHFVNSEFDKGPLIQVNRFPIEMQKQTAYSLEQITQKHLLQTFISVFDKIINHESLPSTPQGEGRYISKKEFELLREISDDDSPELIERKTRAFWFPPYLGAQIKINNQKFTLISNAMLDTIGENYHGMY
jgi:methionyl-tRNA formyltransferase